MAGGLTRLLRAPLGPAEAYARMAAAVGKDLAAAVIPGDDGDPFRKRDPAYIERTLPALRMTSTMQSTLTRLSNQRTLPVLG